MDESMLKEFKAMVGEFQHEIKSNSVIELVVWLDCRSEYENKMMKAMSERRKRK